MLTKLYYDNKHASIRFEKENWILLRLHKNYNILNTIVLDFKLSQQYTKFFQIIEKINNLIYKSNISTNWRVHSVFSITQLESIEVSNKNSFQRISLSADSVFVEEDTKTIKSYEIERIIIKRTNKRKETKYLIRWSEYDSEHDFWRSISKMRNVMNLINDYENMLSLLIIASSDIVVAPSRRDRFKKH